MTSVQSWRSCASKRFWTRCQVSRRPGARARFLIPSPHTPAGWEALSRHKIIHGDISLANIMVSPDGGTGKHFLIDLGLSLCKDGDFRLPSVSNFGTARLPLTCEMQGTLEFVSSRFLRNVSGQFKIEERDDLESFMWVALYVITKVLGLGGNIFPSSNETPASIVERRDDFVKKTEVPSTMVTRAGAIAKQVGIKMLVEKLEGTMRTYRSFSEEGSNATQLTATVVRDTIRTFAKLVGFVI